MTIPSKKNYCKLLGAHSLIRFKGRRQLHLQYIWIGERRGEERGVEGNGLRFYIPPCLDIFLKGRGKGFVGV